MFSCFLQLLFLLPLSFIVTSGSDEADVRSPDFFQAWNKLGPLLKSAHSPFYRYEALIVRLVKIYIKNHREKSALTLLRKVIDFEKEWRFQQCVRLFGEKSCIFVNSSPKPFYIWNKKMIHTLLKDPTKEITTRVRQAVDF